MESLPDGAEWAALGLMAGGIVARFLWVRFKRRAKETPATWDDDIVDAVEDSEIGEMLDGKPDDKPDR